MLRQKSFIYNNLLTYILQHIKQSWQQKVAGKRTFSKVSLTANSVERVRQCRRDIRLWGLCGKYQWQNFDGAVIILDELSDKTTEFDRW